MAEVPSSFKCPISLMPMKDPYIDHEGNSYEREAIMEWLKHNATSPITRNALSLEKLAPNRALRELYNDWLAKNGATHNSSFDGEYPISVASTKLAEEALSFTIVAPPSGVPDVTLKTSSRVLDTSTEGFSDVLASVSICPPEGDAGRTAVDICCVVDVSGSMCSEATMRSSDGSVESHGLSLLDIVKHGVRTVMHSLGDNDRLSLVVYASKAHVVWALTPMSAAARSECEKKLAALKPLDCTNIWAGLELGIKTLEKGASPDRLSHLMILTDGCPTVEPPRGTLEMLRRLRRNSGARLPCSINTFGFGYELDSKLLRNLAEEGCGTYAFIPDAGFVGTIFVNAAANILTTMSRAGTCIKLEKMAGVEVTSVVGGSLQGSQIMLPALQYGQTKDLLVRMRVSPNTPLERLLQGTLLYTSTGQEGERKAHFSVGASSNLSDLNVNRFRMVEAIGRAMSDMEDKDSAGAINAIQQAIECMRDSCGDAHAKAVLADMTGQVTEAFSRCDWYNRWGRHYLPSLTRAHELQQCLNFKDPGVQIYGGALFQGLRDAADDMFCSLPAPTPSNKRPLSPGGASSSTPRRIQMSAYNDASNGCFSPYALLRTASGEHKEARCVKKGDRLVSGDGTIAQVMCVVRSQCEIGCELVDLGGGCVLTPWHPVRVAAGWKFPCEIKDSYWDSSCVEVYNFVLSSTKQTLVVGSIQCVALGHELGSGEQERLVQTKGWEGVTKVVQHPYFGTSLVREDLQKLDPAGWAAGCVRFRSGCLGRDAQSGLLCRYVPEKLIRFAAGKTCEQG